ncbi:hypothetical protein [Serpentinicella alkaliphila]|uniref:Uncharacterized protein n=1 Tax=Serpentinicella alkaliphila TaxID=1734049 RepID=A0A4R2TKJ9_9FIRM|nr:hypothetical protein [Serpentinicella alkaliphila]QUH26612.1 hypothetical protein HZR23_13350 [Serpentinicella alkaliphila]TCQ02922.1 hypothetical protein EDD79_101252 [Serpentinicella alkaliphila]
MKKSIVLLIIVLLFSMTGCVKTKVEDPENEIEVLIGYIVIEGNNLHFDQVEVVKREDKERMEELDLDESDVPNGYAIINVNQEKTTYELADKVVYTFTDVYLNFIEESEDDRVYITTKKDDFLKHLGEYNLNDIPLFEQTIPYFIEVQDGKVISIEERIEYTI